MIEINKIQSKVVYEDVLGQNRTTTQNKSALFLESKERLEFAMDALVNGAFNCAAYYAYTSIVISAKAFLITKNIYRHTHFGILKSFNTYFFEKSNGSNEIAFKDHYQFDIEQTISMKTAQFYVSKALAFNAQLKAIKH